MDLVCPSVNPKAVDALLRELSENAFKCQLCKMRVADSKTGRPNIVKLGKKPSAN